MRQFKLILVAFVLPFFVAAQISPDGKIIIGKIDSVWSKTLKENRQYGIYLPPSYGNPIHAPVKYPVLYLLDGDAHFHSVTGLIQFLSTGINGNFVIPEMIVVAIPNTDRNRDLTPTHTNKGPNGEDLPFLRTTGGGTNFLNFIKNELIPRIDSTYPTSPYRVFVGHSFGGITVIDALYKMPETFSAYVSIDPSLWYDNQLLLKKAKDYFSKANLKGKTLFVGQANTIQPLDTNRNYHFESIMQFNSILENYNKSGLRYAYKYYSNDDHGSAPLITEYDALRFIFDGYKFNFFDRGLTPEMIKEHFKNFSARLGTNFPPSEQQINNAGYQLLQAGEMAKAIALFELNTELYPNSFNTWDSLGEAWMTKGDYKKAIAFYEKSIALNPNNEAGKNMIKKMKEKETKK